MNNTRINWTPELAAEQARKNAERERLVKLQRRAERAAKKLGHINLADATIPTHHNRGTGKSPRRSGYIYVIKVKDLCKIGLTENFSHRIESLKREYGFKAYERIALIKVPNMLAIEAELHRVFSYKRVTGEWFKLAADDLEIIKHISRIL